MYATSSERNIRVSTVSLNSFMFMEQKLGLLFYFKHLLLCWDHALQKVFISKAGFGQGVDRIMLNLWKTGLFERRRGMNCEQRRQERGSAVAGAGSGLGQYMQQCCTNNWKLFFIPLGLFYFLFLLFFEHRKAWRMASAWFCVCAVCWGGGYNTWACSRLLEMCCVLLGAGMS